MRLAQNSIDQDLYQAVLNLEMKVRASGIDKKLYLLVKARASQINSCAFCLDMHMTELRSQGESEERLYLLSAWREAPFSPIRMCLMMHGKPRARNSARKRWPGSLSPSARSISGTGSRCLSAHRREPSRPAYD